MAAHIADALAGVDLGAHAEPTRAIAVIQAGTGVGKSAAYLSTLVALALARKTRLVVSTATVALQEQLMHKDLPALARTLDVPLVYALAKGRGRYVCKLKLERLAAPGGSDELLDGMDDEGRSAAVAAAPGQDPLARRRQLADTLVLELAHGRWDGDRDSLAQPPDARDWSAIAAERHTCTSRHCPRFRDCSYFQARTRLTQAQVIVANHDLVLASLGMKALPELDDCLWVFDEAHHLPSVALDQFASSMELGGLRWLDRLPRVMLDVAEHLGLTPAPDVLTLAAQLKTALLDLGRLALDLLRARGAGFDAVLRFEHGVLPEALLEPLSQVQGQAGALAQALEALGAELKALARDEPTRAHALAQQYVRLGPFAPRLGGVVATSAMWLAQQTPPAAKWLRADTSSGLVSLSLHACPIVPGDLLRQQLWQSIRGAVLTSASLASCGRFDFFLREAGLDGLAQVSTLAVDSPFDYRQQGQLLVVDTRADPRQVDAYTREMVAALLEDLRQVRRGALVLFTSRVQMQAAVEALDAGLRECVQVQGRLARSRLLAAHAARVEAGLPAVIFGLQSFGEGLDLPGALCETVFIAKLPFASPSDPVAEARAEWLRAQGRDPFDELVVPATGMRLLQWSGRAIRTEQDRARIVCYDKRLLDMRFGRRMLQGLPPYALARRSGDAERALDAVRDLSPPPRHGEEA